MTKYESLDAILYSKQYCIDYKINFKKNQTQLLCTHMPCTICLVKRPGLIYTI